MGDKEQAVWDAPPIFVVSGGVGASGEQVARTVLAQFPHANVPVHVIAQVRSDAEVEAAVKQAAAGGDTIVHTLVDTHLRSVLVRLAREHQVVAIDLVGQLLARLTQVLHQEPVGQPGLYRQMREEYFERIEAINFTVAHDDGKSPEDLPQADIVLVGVSRVGKTPLSMYMSTLGWKVANVPIVPGVPPPRQLFQIDRRRVVGLTVDADYLIQYRQWRQRRMGVPPAFGYADPAAVDEEMEAVRDVFRRGGFPIVNMTSKPIETSAEEIAALVTQRLKSG